MPDGAVEYGGVVVIHPASGFRHLFLQREELHALTKDYVENDLQVGHCPKCCPNIFRQERYVNMKMKEKVWVTRDGDGRPEVHLRDGSEVEDYDRIDIMA